LVDRRSKLEVIQFQSRSSRTVIDSNAESVRAAILDASVEVLPVISPFVVVNNMEPGVEAMELLQLIQDLGDPNAFTGGPNTAHWNGYSLQFDFPDGGEQIKAGGTTTGGKVVGGQPEIANRRNESDHRGTTDEPSENKWTSGNSRSGNGRSDQDSHVQPGGGVDYTPKPTPADIKENAEKQFRKYRDDCYSDADMWLRFLERPTNNGKRDSDDEGVISQARVEPADGENYDLSEQEWFNRFYSSWWHATGGVLMLRKSVDHAKWNAINGIASESIDTHIDPHMLPIPSEVTIQSGFMEDTYEIVIEKLSDKLAKSLDTAIPFTFKGVPVTGLVYKFTTLIWDTVKEDQQLELKEVQKLDPDAQLVDQAYFGVPSIQALEMAASTGLNVWKYPNGSWYYSSRKDYIPTGPYSERLFWTDAAPNERDTVTTNKFGSLRKDKKGNGLPARESGKRMLHAMGKAVLGDLYDSVADTYAQSQGNPAQRLPILVFHEYDELLEERDALESQTGTISESDNKDLLNRAMIRATLRQLFEVVDK
jgi:hypothetical protein